MPREERTVAASLRFYEGAEPKDEDPPRTHMGKRIVYVQAYERALDQGKSDEEARTAARGQVRLWHYGRVALGMPADRPAKGEITPDGGFVVRYPFSLSEDERQPYDDGTEAPDVG